MFWGRNRSAARAPVNFCRTLPLLCALVAAGCNTTAQQSSVTFGEERGVTVAFESIEGLPRGVFDALVRDLNAEAQSRRLAVVSRDGASAYRLRGYLGASRSPQQSTVSWVWDVYDRQQRRVLRISGEEKVAGKHKDVWQLVDDSTVRRIAQKSVEQLASFLASADRPLGLPATAYGGDASPEAAGIFRMPPAESDPLRSDGAPPPDTTSMEQTADVSASKRPAANRVVRFSSESPQGTN